MSTVTKNTRPEPNGGGIVAQVSDGLAKRIQTIEELLPRELKERADWFVKRALMTFSQTDSLRKCSATSFITAVVRGAEVGLPIDGKLGYAVPYWNAKKGETEAQFQPSYMGLILVAKRSGQIVNCYSGMVFQNDDFRHGRNGDKCVLEHTWSFGSDRGEPLGAYAVVSLPGDTWTYELMSIEDLNAIRNRSKASGSGPWVTDPDEMMKKTVLRRALKTYCNDPGFVLAAQYDEAEYEGHQDRTPAKRIQRSSLNDHLDLSTPVHAKQVPAERIEHDQPEQPSLPAPGQSVDQVLTDIGTALRNQDRMGLSEIDNAECGPDSTRTPDEIDIISAAIRQAKAQMDGKGKGQKQAFDTHPNT